MIGFCINLSSQSDIAPWSVGLSFGKMEYDGVRGSSTFFGSPMKTQFGGRVSKYLNPSLDLALGFTTGSHGLNDADDNFEGSAWQANFAAHWKFLKREKFNPFLSAGLGLLNYSDDTPTAVSPSGVDASGLAVPVGLGIKANITDGFGVYWHSQYGIYMGDSYNGVNADETDTHMLHEFGIALNLGKQDRDGDKVADKKDACPDTPGLKEFDGCPDSDMDGIIDSEDDCPQVAGLAEFRGCPDTDGDGVIDKNDNCPEVAGEEQYSGCPDTDGDGVSDDKDECVDEVGLSRYNGCPIPDTDGDGFNDEDDECINVKGDLRGCPDADGDGFHDQEDECVNEVGTVKGCPDADGDGIADKDDECPDEAGIPEKNGCPKVRKPTTEEIINGFRSPDINFISGTRTDDEYDADIAAIMEFHQAYPEAFLHISGYSDSQGAESSNMRMSERRAKKVYQKLLKEGVPAEQMTYEGYGETNPVADNGTKEGRMMNRRVSVTGSTVKREIETNTKR